MFLILFLAALAAYLVDFGWFVYRLAKDRPAPRLQHGILTLAFVLHTSALLARSLMLRQCPIFNLEDSLSFLAWAMVLICLLMRLLYRPNPLEGFAPALAIALSGASLLFYWQGGSTQYNVPPTAEKMWVSLHAGLYFMAYVAFAISFLSAGVYLLLQRRLKQRHVTGMTGSLGSLEAMDKLNYVSLLAGVLCLSAGIAAGVVVLGKGPAGWIAQSGKDPKILLSLITWILYALLVAARATHRLRGRKVALLSLLGFAVILLTFMGVHHLAKVF